MHEADGDLSAMPTQTTYGWFAVLGWRGGAFAAGEDGVILRFDGQEWRRENSPVDWHIWDLYGLSPNDIWAVGASAIEICHFDGRRWKPQDIVPFQGDCVSVWASSPHNVFITSNNGVVQHFDGTGWARLPRYLTETESVWGAVNGDLFVAGEGIIRLQR